MIMIWQWWGLMFVVGLGIGSIAAWTTQAARLFMTTLAAPLVLVLTRVLWPKLYPIKNSPLYFFIDFVLIAVAAFTTDYFLGLRLGRNDRAGYRNDSVGH